MLLTPLETAIIMSAVEGQLVTTRQVYYRLDMAAIIGLRVGTALRIPEGEIEGYYEAKGLSAGKPFPTERVGAITGLFKCYGNRIIFARHLPHGVPAYFVKATRCVQAWRKKQLAHKQRKCAQVFTKKRNNYQLEFTFAA